MLLAEKNNFYLFQCYSVAALISSIQLLLLNVFIHGIAPIFAKISLPVLESALEHLLLLIRIHKSALKLKLENLVLVRSSQLS